MIPINGETGNDLGIDVVEKVVNETKGTHNIMILDNVYFGLNRIKVSLASIFW
jgi:hypothetical protein